MYFLRTASSGHALPIKLRYASWPVAPLALSRFFSKFLPQEHGYSCHGVLCDRAAKCRVSADYENIQVYQNNY